ncbi:MAG TPA: MFS transporter [Bryobacteraceae bacterium]|jgi:ACS family hexuronate transporter-like MFS transporter
MPSRSRHFILALIFTCAVINYIDRQALSVAAPTITALFHMSNTDYSRVLFCFLLAYALFQPLCGWLLDRIGTVTGFALAVIWWSAACAMHALAQGPVSFGAFRFLLGAGEAALIPASIKAITEWLPQNHRAAGIGIMNSGISFGGMIATPIVAGLLLSTGWRSMFLVTGCLGFLWLIFWLLFIRGLTKEHAELTPTRSIRVDYWALLRRKEIVGLILSRIISDPAWYFYMFWLPSYLTSQRGFDMKALRDYGWIPFFTAGCGALFSGWLATRLLSRGWTTDHTRKGVLLLAAALMPLGVMVTFVPNVWLAFALVSLVTLLIQIWATSLFAIPSDLFPPSQVASIVGFATATGSASAMLFQLFVGALVDHFSYAPVFVIVALMHPVALLCISKLIPKIEPLEVEGFAPQLASN